MHFRWATNGSIRRANCHPFKRGDVFFAHNGVLDIAARGDLTDSQTAFDDIIYPAIAQYGYGSKQMRRAVAAVIGPSKFAFLKGRELLLFGNYIHQPDGCYYSNLNFTRYMGFDGHVALYNYGRPVMLHTRCQAV